MKATTAQSDNDNLKTAILDAYDRLADGRSTSAGLDGTPVLKVPVAEFLREEVKDRGFLETKDTGGLTDRARTYFSRAKNELLFLHQSHGLSRRGVSFGDDRPGTPLHHTVPKGTVVT